MAVLEKQREEQLEFDLTVGGDDPVSASFKVSGAMRCKQQLLMADDVTVQIRDADGQVIAEGEGSVGSLTFKEHRRSDEAPWTERIHSIKLK